MPRVAILQCPDTGSLESLVIMLRAVGYECRLPSAAIKQELRRIGHKYVLDIDSLVRGMGYEYPLTMPEASLGDMDRDDVLYVDIKAHQHHDRIVARWPNLAGRVLWYRINGGAPEHVVKRDADGHVTEDHGDERNPPCPILTPNLWYADAMVPVTGALVSSAEGAVKAKQYLATAPWAGRAYACYPPFYRFDEYYPQYGRAGSPHVSLTFQPPVCLIHGVNGWGYRDLVDPLRALGVKCHGAPSPDGLIPHKQIPVTLSRTLCMVHLKSSDAPGYSLYECLAAACPVVCTRRLIWRCRMGDLLIPGKTCLVFDRETHDGLTPDDVADCTREVSEHLELLRDPEVNRTIGMAGRERLRELMWSESRTENVEGLRAFLGRHYA